VRPTVIVGRLAVHDAPLADAVVRTPFETDAHRRRTEVAIARSWWCWPRSGPPEFSMPGDGEGP
jgi:hypothetical protein